jgi:hypothetical protein
MLQNSGSVTTRYREVLREFRDPRFYDIRITGKMVRGLLKRGYLWPNECDDLNGGGLVPLLKRDNVNG